MRVETLKNRVDWNGRIPTLTLTPEEEAYLRNHMSVNLWMMAVTDAMKAGLPDDIIALYSGVALRSGFKIATAERLQHLADLLPADD